MNGDLVHISLCGDVMLGRGIDRILPRPGSTELREAFIRDADAYVRLAESAHGPIPRPADFSWPWGDAVDALREAPSDVTVVNLETSVTGCDDFAPGKGIHYRMNPANLPTLSAFRPDVCVLANNHVLDFGRTGLSDTRTALSGAGLATAGAGEDVGGACRPAVVPVAGGARVLVFSMGMPSSGIPSGWAATYERSGVCFVPHSGAAAAAPIARDVREAKRPGDIAVVSIHWGSNWGYEIPPADVEFARALIDGGVDVVHGHSSHHPRPVEIHRGKPVFYGCGDFVNDYEGIPGFEEFRDDLRLLCSLSVDPATGMLVHARMTPFQARRFRLNRASRADTEWLRAHLAEASREFGTRIDLAPEDEDGALLLRPG